MNKKIFNYLGEDITNKGILLAMPEYGYVDENNIPHINWGEETEKCDKDGFDKEFRPNPNSDVYIIENYLIPKGTMLCRYGFEGGIFTTLKGSTYENLGLPYVKETIEYHEYKVTEDLEVDCYVVKGVVAPKFLSNGGAIQFKHKQEIFLECEDGYLEEDLLWIQNCI